MIILLLWVLNPIPFSFVSSEQSLTFGSIEKADIRLLKNQIVALKLSPNSNIFETTLNNTMNPFESSIYDIEEVSSLVPIDIKTKTQNGKNSIFVQGFQAIQKFPARPKLNYDDASNNLIIKPSVMLRAHLTCIKNIEKLPREITKKDRKVKFDKNYSGLFKEKYETFGYNLYLEENLSKDSSKNKIKQGKQKLFKKYGEASKNELREKLFQNPCIIKSEKCKYLETEEFVTIYYDELTDLFAIIDSNKNTVLDFGIATEVKYAEIFSYKSLGTKKITDLCVSQKPLGEYQNEIPQNNEPAESKELEVYREPYILYILSYDEALAILEAKYGSNFIAVEKDEFKIQDWQAVKKLEHAVCFRINLDDYGVSQDQAKAINAPGGLVSYVRKGQKLPSLDLIRAYQNAIKNFCEDRNQSARNDESSFRGKPSITFFNEDTRQVAVFNRETKIFITAYKLAERSVDEYLTTGNIGNN